MKNSNGTLTISPSYIVRHKYNSWLCAQMTVGSKKITPYFEVDNRYADYLCVERSDPFLVLALTCATLNNFNIRCETPVTDTLYYNLTSFLIPTLARTNKSRYDIAIDAPQAPPLETAGGVATGFSGGVDSWYSVLKNIDPCNDKFRLTHLMLHNGGGCTILMMKNTNF